MASAITLTNGSGDGDISADLDVFGRTTYVLYDPVGALRASDPVYRSEIFLGLAGGGLRSLTSSGANASIISQSDTQLVTGFSVGNLAFTLTQTVGATFEGENRTGSILTQTFAISNQAETETALSMVRYFDGDLFFTDGSRADGGGVLTQNGQTVLFETDVSGSANDPSTFVGITGLGGTSAGFAVQQCCGVNAYPLPNTVDNDTDGDGFTNSSYDVTLQLQRDFSIAAGATEYFTTATLFGNGTPPLPGTIEDLPWVDETPETNDDGVPVYSFDIPANYEPQETIWIDPIVAVGYTYTVTGTDFYSVTAPSTLSVNDPDGYTLTAGSLVRPLLGGETYVFGNGSGITSFTLTGINPEMGLLPDVADAFVTGIALNVLTGSTVVTMTPITADYNPDPVVPLPASIWLLMAGMGGLAALRRRKI